MRKIVVYLILVIFSFAIFSCSDDNEKLQTDLVTQRALAEAEAAEANAKAAEAETKLIQAQLELEKEKLRLENEREKSKKAEEKAIKKEDVNLRNKVKGEALEVVKQSGVSILRQAYPLAGNKLSFKGAESIGTSDNGNGYSSTVRLHYSNIFKQSQYLDLRFDYDKQAGYRSWKFVNHTDVIAPKELTISTLLNFLK